ncbi:MAG: glycosyltransferase, partial [Lachnospiraceae bacterium]|nr:glycosyltransferase [Lachnospiraceae bacterium]
MSMAQPLVSIIVPVYNGEKTIERCLRSIQNQSYSNI